MRNYFDIDPDVKVLLPDGSTRSLADYWWPTVILMMASFVLTVSLFVPYWQLTLHAPQYPAGLTVQVYANRLEGDVREVDELNHYLGMPSLNEGGQIEKSIAMDAIAVMAALVVAAVFIHNRWAWLITLPAVMFPLIFLFDLHMILDHYGHSIDPHSALGGAIPPFTPPLLGEGNIGQFSTVAQACPGLYLAVAASVLVLVGMWCHKRAYKALRQARRRAGTLA